MREVSHRNMAWTKSPLHEKHRMKSTAEEHKEYHQGLFESMTGK